MIFKLLSYINTLHLIDKCLSEFPGFKNYDQQQLYRGPPVFFVGDTIHISAGHVILLIGIWLQKHTNEMLQGQWRIKMQMFHGKGNAFNFWASE